MRYPYKIHKDLIGRFEIIVSVLQDCTERDALTDAEGLCDSPKYELRFVKVMYVARKVGMYTLRTNFAVTRENGVDTSMTL